MLFGHQKNLTASLSGQKHRIVVEEDITKWNFKMKSLTLHGFVPDVIASVVLKMLGESDRWYAMHEKPCSKHLQVPISNYQPFLWILVANTKIILLVMKSLLIHSDWKKYIYYFNISKIVRFKLTQVNIGGWGITACLFFKPKGNTSSFIHP